MSSNVSASTVSAAESACQAGMDFLSRGELAAACIAFREAIEKDPSIPHAYLGLGNSLRRLRQPGEAELALRHALNLDPALREAAFSLAFLLHAAGRDTEAGSVLTQLAGTQSEDLLLQRQITGLLMDFECYEMAVPIAQRVTSQAPAAGAWQRLGVCLLYLDRKTEAEQAFLTAIEYEPKAGQAYLLLTQTRRATVSDRNRIGQFQAVLKDNEIAGESRACLHYALGNWSEDLGNYSEAWEQFSAGNSLRHREHPFDRAVWSQYFQRLLHMPMPQPESDTEPDATRPVFLVGLPGAGSGPLSQLLASHPSICSLGNSGQVDSLARACEQLTDGVYPECLDKLTSAQLVGLAKGFRSDWPEKSFNSKWVLDENAFNFLHIALIMMVFPESCILHYCRQPMDECLSAHLCNFPQPNHNYALDLKDMGFFFRQYSALMQRWQDSLPAGRLLQIDPERGRSDAAMESARIWQFLGLDAPLVQTPMRSASQIGLPLDPMRRDSSGRWRHYRGHLRTLQDATNSGTD